MDSESFEGNDVAGGVHPRALTAPPFAVTPLADIVEDGLAPKLEATGLRRVHPDTERNPLRQGGV